MMDARSRGPRPDLPGPLRMQVTDEVPQRRPRGAAALHDRSPLAAEPERREAEPYERGIVRHGPPRQHRDSDSRANELDHGLGERDPGYFARLDPGRPENLGEEIEVLARGVVHDDVL